jgi:hypothetical protein
VDLVLGDGVYYKGGAIAVKGGDICAVSVPVGGGAGPGPGACAGADAVVAGWCPR